MVMSEDDDKGGQAGEEEEERIQDEELKELLNHVGLAGQAMDGVEEDIRDDVGEPVERQVGREGEQEGRQEYLGNEQEREDSTVQAVPRVPGGSELSEEGRGDVEGDEERMDALARDEGGELAADAGRWEESAEARDFAEGRADSAADAHDPFPSPSLDTARLTELVKTFLLGSRGAPVTRRPVTSHQLPSFNACLDRICADYIDNPSVNALYLVLVFPILGHTAGINQGSHNKYKRHPDAYPRVQIPEPRAPSA